MKNKILKVVGYLQIIIIAFFFFTFIEFSKGTLLFPVYFKITLYVILTLLSSFGIIFGKKLPFLSTVYLYAILATERIDRLFIIFHSDAVTNTSSFYLSEIISGSILLSYCLCIILLVLSKNVRDVYQIEKKTVLINLGVAIAFAFCIGPAYFPIINTVVRYIH